MLKFGLFGIPVSIRWTFWLLPALFSGELFSQDAGAIPRLLAWIIAFFVAVLWHELGHAFFQRKFGMFTQIELYFMGGLAIGSGRTPTRRERIMIAAAGPAFGLVLGGVILALSRYGLISVPAGNQFLGVLLVGLIVVNIGLSILNLLPVLPLDGGNIAQALFGDVRKALQLSLVTAIMVAVGGLLIGHTFLTVLFGFMALQSYQRLKGVPTGFGPFR